jgi:hypothetical protein
MTLEYLREFPQGQNSLSLSLKKQSAMITKKILDKTISKLPESFTIDELIEKLLFMEKVEEGIRQADEEKVVTNEDVRLMIEKWSK